MDQTSHSPYIDSKRIGDALVSVFLDGTIHVPIQWVLQAPEVELRRVVELDTDGKARFDHIGFHVRYHDASILIDAGMDEPDSPWGQRSKEKMGMVRPMSIMAGLKHIGVAPEEITHVLFTHYHWDHVLGATIEQEDGTFIPRYPHARHILNRADWVGTGTLLEIGSSEMARMDALQQHGLLELIDGDYEVMPGITMLFAPGESPGHSIVRIESAGETFYTLADLIHHTAEFEHPDWTRGGFDKAQLQLSRQQYLPVIAASQAVAIFAHACFPGWGRVITTGTGYRWEPLKDDMTALPTDEPEV